MKTRSLVKSGNNPLFVEAGTSGNNPLNKG